MATSTLIQRLDSASADTMNRAQYEYFIAAENISAGSIVALDCSTGRNDSDRALYIREYDATSVSVKAAIGVLFADVESGENAKVCIKGYCEGAKVAPTLVAKGDQISPDVSGNAYFTAVNNQVDEGGTATYSNVFLRAYALEAESGGKADIYIL